MGSTPRPQLDEGNIGNTPAQLQDYNNILNTTTHQGTSSGLPNGEEILNRLLEEMRNGLPGDFKKKLEAQGKGAISGNLKTGEEQLRRTVARQGDVPIGAKTDALAGLNQNANKSLNDLYLGIGDMDYKAMQNAFAKYGDLNRLAFGKSALVNDSRLKGYEIDKANEFSWGDALGGLFGAGGNVLGGLASGNYL